MARQDPTGLTVNVGAVEVKISGTQRFTTTYYFAGGQRIALRRDGEITYLHGDHLGSASLATDASGAEVSDMRYTPFGETRYGDAPTDRRFTGQREEAGIGLYDYGARFYSSSLGRFVSADSIIPDPRNPQDFNRYTYVRNNFLKYTDPSGHCLTPFCIGEIALLSAALLLSGCDGYRSPHPAPAPAGEAAPYYYSVEYGWFDPHHLGDHNVLTKVRDAVERGGRTIELNDSQVGGLQLDKSYWVSGDITEEQIPGVAYAIFMDFQSGWENWQGENGEFFTYYSIDDLPSNTLAFIASLQNTTPDALLQEIRAYPTYKSPPDPQLDGPTAGFLPMRLNLETGEYTAVNWPWELPTPLYNSRLWHAVSARKTPLLMGDPRYIYYYE